MKTNFLLCLLVSTAFLAGCDNEMPDYYDSRTYDLKNFDAVELGDALQIEIVQSNNFSVVASGETPDLEDLELRVENGVLLGNYRHGSRSHKRTRLVIFMPQLSAAVLEAATDTKVIGFTAPQDMLFLRISGASTARVDGNFGVLEARMDGASDLILTGESDVLDVVVGGASHLKAAEFITTAATIEVGGASEAFVSVRDRLEGSVQGNSFLRYHGNPQILDVYVASDSRMGRF